MDAKHIKSINKQIDATITKVVNGKIDKMQAHLIQQDAVLKKIQEELKKLKVDTDPLIEGKKAATILGKFVLWLSAIILAIAGVVKLLVK